MAKAKEATKDKGAKATVETGVMDKVPVSRKRKQYLESVVPALREQFGYTSVMAVPRLEKIVVNMGVGKGEEDAKHLENSVRDLSLIAGQKPIITRAKKAVSNFKIREGHRIGCCVTLRGERMYHFFDKLVSIVLPRLRDFRGISPKSFDGRGNFAVGLKEQIVFPEIAYDTFDRIRGMDIVICTTAKTDEEARVFLQKMGMPFREN
ncbi:MAG: 50S ribosomal protein L5 [Fimbriimonadales bacterium]